MLNCFIQNLSFNIQNSYKGTLSILKGLYDNVSSLKDLHSNYGTLYRPKNKNLQDLRRAHYWQW